MLSDSLRQAFAFAFTPASRLRWCSLFQLLALGPPTSSITLDRSAARAKPRGLLVSNDTRCVGLFLFCNSMVSSLAEAGCGRSSSSRFSSGTSVSQSVGSLLRSSTGTRKNSSRPPLSSTRVSCCVFGRRTSSDGSSPVRRRTSFNATSLKPGFLYQGTPSGEYGTGRHCPHSCRVRHGCASPTRLAVSSTETNARPETEPVRVFRPHAEPAVLQHHKGQRTSSSR
jgi:hypothetical protein